MSGHSKWSTIKHKKAAQDAKRGKLFTRLIKEITVAARMCGGDIDANPRLRTAVATARSQSMPYDNIQRAIKKGTGELEGENYEEIVYEGYGPHNVAVIIESMTDNRNRTIASMRYIFNKCGGNLGSTNSVQYMFDRIGSIRISKSCINEENLTELILEVGAEDMNSDDPEAFEVVTAPADFDQVRSALEDQSLEVVESGIIWSPQQRTVIEDLEKAEQVIKFMDMLEDDDDVQKIHSNFDLSDAVAASLA
jgi:YebC/PmpR family DNA-binding regulatory protein